MAAARTTTTDCAMRWAGEELALLPERAVWWPAHSTMFIADLHLGKAAAFRAAGIPVPETTMLRDLDTLSAALDRTEAERLIVLGDLVHSRSGLTPRIQASVSAWRDARAALAIDLVVGNHDRAAGRLPESWNIGALAPGSTLGPFTLLHNPADTSPHDDGRHALAGHLHPAVRLDDRAKRTALRCPTFVFEKRLAILPAFASFAGNALVRPEPGMCLYVIGDGEVIPINGAAAGCRA